MAVVPAPYIEWPKTRTVHEHALERVSTEFGRTIDLAADMRGMRISPLEVRTSSALDEGPNDRPQTATVHTHSIDACEQRVA